MGNRLKPRKVVLVGYLLPSLLVYVLIFIIPTLMAVVLSFFRLSSIRSYSFIRLENYRTLFGDANVWMALRNNLFLIVVCLFGQIGIGFVLAGILSSSKVILRGLYRTVIYFPVTLSAVVIGYVAEMVFDYNYGIITFVLKAVGRPDWVVPWLGQASTVMICVTIPLVWQYAGFHLVVILSAMTAIEREIYDMSEIDGANGIQKAIHITLPLIWNTLTICSFLCISANMKVFDNIMAMTNGGSGYSSNVLALYAYNVSFSQMNMGYGSTVSVAMLVVTSFLVLTSSGLMRVRRLY